MRFATDDRPIRRLSRAVALPLVLGWIGCAALDHGQTLVPTRHQIRTGPFILLSNFPMRKIPPRSVASCPRARSEAAPRFPVAGQG